MPITKEEFNKYQRERRQRIKAEKEEVDRYVNEFSLQDEVGERYKSEVLSYKDLRDLFLAVKNESEDLSEYKLKKTKKVVVNPSRTVLFGKKQNFQEWLDLRDRARKDLFWLATAVLGKFFTEFTHREMFNQFVQKNFDGCFPKDYTLQHVHRAIDKQVRVDENGEETKDMLLLFPRGFHKSTADGVDCVQWLLNVPDIRILILTGEFKLAAAFMKEIKEYFNLPVSADPKPIHLLFPEYVLTGLDGSSMQPMECPARKHSQKEASLWVNSIDANLSGWHCDLKKGDDVVTDNNCNSPDAREKLKEKFDGTDNLLDEWGFSDNIGTRYWTDDWYSKRVRPDDLEDLVPIKYFCKACWTVKPEYQEVPLKQLEEHMVILTFPEKATFKSLRKKLLKNERQFRNQQLNEPTDSSEDSGFKIAFTEDALRAHLYPLTAAPKIGDIFLAWDWAPSSGKYSDYSCGVVARVVIEPQPNLADGTPVPAISKLVILDIIFDKWKPSELAFQIIMLNKKWNPKQAIIEKSNGAELLQMELQRQALRYATTLNIYWKPLDIKADAKRNRIKGLETLLNTDRLWFVAGSWTDEMMRQLLRYTGERKNRGRKDDIPDAMSFLPFFLPSTIQNEETKLMMEAQEKLAAQKRSYERIFGGQQMTRTELVDVPQIPTDPRSKFGIPGLRYN
jgi:hypothetical protein